MGRFINPIAVAIDTREVAKATALADALAGQVGCLKIGMEFFYAQGASGYERVAQRGVPIFLDLKVHDISNTVVAALESLMMLKPRPAIINMHASAGAHALQMAAQAVAGRAQLIAVTVLTSLAEADLKAIGFDPRLDVSRHSLELARLAKEAGLDGVVCSPHETAMIKQTLGKDFLAVVPGVRPQGSDPGDQKRVATPQFALKAGADLLVIGRPITQAADPVAAAQAIAKELLHAG